MSTTALQVSLEVRQTQFNLVPRFKKIMLAPQYLFFLARLQQKHVKIFILATPCVCLSASNKLKIC
jgi:hypothetical protein